MTELSYTAWDDNRYQWPPPEGWYQASDGKWWPEGYGPVAGQGATEAEVGSAEEAVGAEHGSLGEADAEGGEVATQEFVGEQAAAEFDSGFDAAVAHGDEFADDHVEQVSEEVDAPVEATTDVGANGTSEIAPVDEPEYDVDLDTVASGFAGSPDTAHPAESPFESESRFSTSSAGMAASGFASRTEGGSSSLGLAGWAQTGSSDVRNRVDVGQEYDYSQPDGESTEFLDPIEVSGDEHDLDVSDLDTPDLEAHDLDPAGFDTSGHVSGDLDATDAAVAAALDTSTVDVPTVDAPTEPVDTEPVDTEPVDTEPVDTEPVDSTLSRLDDLKRQVEQQSFPTQVGGADATVPVSDLEIGGIDPTETLDIDPNDLSLESNPYYGGADDTETHGTSSDADTDEPVGAGTSDGDYGVIDEAGIEQGYGDPVDADSEAYGFAAAGESTIDAPHAAETRQYGYEGEPAAPVGDQPVPMAPGYGETEADYSGPATLSPMSSAAPKPGRGRMILYVVIGLLALAVAGVAGYLLFQLQSDDDADSGGVTGATAAVAGSAAGPSDTSGQGPGSFSNPHELAGGVRLTVPLGDDGAEVWMLQVREPATSNDVGDENVEVTSRIRVRNDSTSGDLTASDLRFVLVSADGSTGTTAAESCSSGDDLNRQAAIEPGKDIEGNVCWTVPAAQASGALLGIESIHAGGRVHVNLS